MSRYPHTILATCCVPWTEHEDLDEAVFRDSIRILLKNDLRHLYVFGTAGEGYAVSDSQFEQIVGVFAEEMKAPGAVPMVGVISLSLSTIIERIERCAAHGITDFQLSLPSWGALDDEEMYRFFDDTCARFPQLQFLHYNLPRARRVVTAAEYAVLVQAHPNLVATKNAGADLATIQELMVQAPQLRHFFTEPGYRHASLCGDAGLLLSVATINPALAREYFDAGARGDAATVAAMATELAAITAELLDLLGETRIDGAYDKCFSKVLDPRFPLRLLPPYKGASDDAFAAFVAAVTDRFPRWLAPRAG